LIIVKFLGGAKKIFAKEEFVVNNVKLTIQELIDILLKEKPKNSPDLDINNILIAVNGVDSSAIHGKSTQLVSNDVVSIIPIIHGGSHKRIQFNILNSIVELNEIIIEKKTQVNFFIQLRKKFPKLVIQGISSQFILNKFHAKNIVALSLEYKRKKILLSKKLETDILMRFAGTTQILQAIEQVGIGRKNNFCIIAIGSKVSLNNLYNYLKPFSSASAFSQDTASFLKNYFKITDTQLNTVMSKTPLDDLLIEKASILI